MEKPQRNVSMENGTTTIAFQIAMAVNTNVLMLQFVNKTIRLIWKLSWLSDLLDV